MTIEALASLPLSAELLEYYQQRARTQETELANFVEKLNEITPKYEKIHSLEWELFTRTKELEILKNKLSDSNIALFEERKHLLKVVAENDALKVQELKDKKKIRYLLSCTQEIPLENETTYIKDSLSKKIVRIQNEQKSRQQSKDQPKPKFAKHDSNVVILEDEIEALKLTLLATQTQLEEQKATYEDTIQNFEKDRYQKVQESKIRSEYDDAKIKSLHEQVDKLRAMCRENTRELLQSKKDFKVRERQLHEAKTYLNQQVKHLADEVETQTERNENIERVVEEKVVKKQESLVSDLRHVLGRTEEDLRIAKANYEQMEHTYKKKQEFLKQRADSITQSYNSLKKRRDHEIEGFTNDIIHLRKSLKKLEKYILKFGPLEDKELVLLDIARETGLKIEKISSSLSGLKNRIYLAENELRNLAF